MYILNDQQIDYILNDIKIRGVEMEDLQLNLLDHICCIVEYELDQGEDFENFYKKTIPRFFKKELKEIQEETTLLLTFKHYYAMKRTMNTVGIIASIGIVLGAIFRFLHLPGANVLLILGVALVSFVFLPLMFTLKLKESTEKRDKLVLTLGCIVSIISVIAAAFKLMHWPYGNILIGLSVLLLLLVFVPVYIFTGVRNPATKLNTIINTVLLIAGSGLVMSLSTNKSTTRSMITGIGNMQKQLAETVKKVDSENTLLLQSIPPNQLTEDVKYYLTVSKITKEYIGTLKTNLIMTVERVPATTAENMSPNDILNVDDVAGTAIFMMGPDYSGKEGNIVGLQSKLHELKTVISQLKDAQKNHWAFDGDVNPDSYKFVPFGYVYSELTQLQYEIANMDRQILGYYSGKL